MEKGRQRQVRALHRVYCDPLVSYGGASWRLRIYAPPSPHHLPLFLSTPMILPLWTFKTVSDQTLPSRCYFMPFDCYCFILVLCYYFVLLPSLLLWLLLLTRLTSFDFILLLRLLWCHFIRSYVRNLKRISFIELAVRIKTRNSQSLLR